MAVQGKKGRKADFSAFRQSRERLSKALRNCFWCSSGGTANYFRRSSFRLLMKELGSFSVPWSASCASAKMKFAHCVNFASSVSVAMRPISG